MISTNNCDGFDYFVTDVLDSIVIQNDNVSKHPIEFICDITNCKGVSHLVVYNDIRYILSRYKLKYKVSSVINDGIITEESHRMNKLGTTVRVIWTSSSSDHYVLQRGGMQIASPKYKNDADFTSFYMTEMLDDIYKQFMENGPYYNFNSHYVCNFDYDNFPVCNAIIEFQLCSS